jgi:predicted ATP-grasp superfamily ATP-dependent carboligase
LTKAARWALFRGIPDPEEAAILVDSLGKITENTSLKIDTTELRKHGAAIKTRIENIIQSSKQEQTQTQTSVRDGVMYG